MAGRFVIDTSILTKAVFDESGSEHVRRWLAVDLPILLAPDHIRLELLSVGLKKRRGGAVGPGAIGEVVERALEFVTEFTPTVDLTDAALSIAERAGISIYDGLFCALTFTSEAPLVSADQALLTRLAKAGVSLPHLTAADLP